MTTGDLMYSNVCTSPLVVLVRRGDGQFWDFAAGAFSVPAKPIAAKYWVAMTADPLLPTTWRCTIPAAAADDPQAELIEAILPASGHPQPSQSFWIGGPGPGPGGDGVPFARATGCVVRFTG